MLRVKVFVVFILSALLMSCASSITHKIAYPPADELFITMGDDPASESIRPYIPKGQLIHVSTEWYPPLPIFGILVVGNADPQYVFSREVIPQVKYMGGDALIMAEVQYRPRPNAFLRFLMGGMLLPPAQTIVVGQVVKRGSSNIKRVPQNEGATIVPEKTVASPVQPQEKPFVADEFNQPAVAEFDMEKMSVQLNTGLVIPSGFFSDIANTGIMLDATLGYEILPNVSINALIGYHNFGQATRKSISYVGSETREITLPDNNFIPILFGGGMKFRNEQFQGVVPYVNGYMGYTIALDDDEFSYQNENNFGIAVEVGALYPVSKIANIPLINNSMVKAALSYNRLFTGYEEDIKYWGLTIGFVYNNLAIFK